MIYQVDRGSWVISSGGSWLPGSFATKGAAHVAFRLTDSQLAQLNKKINIKEKRDITLEDVRMTLKTK